MATEEREQLDLEVAGQKLAFKGTGMQLLVVLLAVVLAATVGFFIYQHDAKADKQDLKTEAALQEVVKSIDKNKDSNERKFNTLIYVLTLSDVERKKLNLAKPQDLRDMQR